ncbi:hypothetical protein [Aureliella helgolandensis]|uniref:Tetratricopeptide repeat protein n=1 Tax=Aureliella helgolandensis TaxID=2527968 RepID=A0A518G1P5_9BACT|nr:hypothetical protein [Aureliella helgolandensis]QDV22507.1 Tetratricopeptide repeat protein [Aureliella helgolandensis]
MSRTCISLIGLYLILCPLAVRAQDLAAQYGTQSREAAQLLNRGIELVQSTDAAQGLQYIDRALSVDPSFQMAMYWQGLAYQEMGDMGKSLESYEKLYQSAAPGRTQMPVEGCFNAGVSSGQSGKLSESAIWLSRALTLDPADEFGTAAKVYRNLAITLAQQKQFSSAALCATAGHQIDPQTVEEGMVESFSRNAESEVATILFSPTQPIEIPYRESVEHGEPQIVEGIEGPLGGMVDLVEQHAMLILPKDEKFVQILDYSKGMKLRTIKTQGRPRAACYVGGKLFVALTSPDRISVLNTRTGKEESTWRLNQPAPTSLAVAPQQRVAYFANSGKIRILDLDDGSIEISPFEATSLAADPKQENVYAIRTPEIQVNTETGHFLFNGRPVFFQIDDNQSGDMQTSLFRLKICDKHLVLAQARICAASNGRRVVVSPDGAVVAVVGGGGWRPLDRSAGSGYGIPVFAANDFSQVVRFVETDAYPLAATINPVSHLVAARGGEFVLSHLVNDDQQLVQLEGGTEDLNQETTFAEFSGDGKWLFANTSTQLYAIPTELNRKENSTNWYSELQRAIKQ